MIVSNKHTKNSPHSSSVAAIPTNRLVIHGINLYAPTFSNQSSNLWPSIRRTSVVTSV